MAFVKKMRRFGAKLARKGGKYLRKRYVTKTGKGLRVRQIAKDVAVLKAMVNAEKKNIINTTVQTAVAQINYNTDSGYILNDITPLISQGVTDSTRNGDSVKGHSMVIRGQLMQQANTQTDIKVRLLVLETKGIPETPTMGQIFNQNPLTSCTDYNSIRNPDFYKNYSVVADKRFKLPSHMYSSQSTVFKDFQVNIRFRKGYHIRYSNNTNTVSNGQLILVMLADNGNLGALASSNLTIPNGGAFTGSLCKYWTEFFYYDN